MYELLATALLAALPDPAIRSVEDENTAPEVFLVPRAERAKCTRPGTICAFSGGTSTLAGVQRSDDGGAVTVLARGSRVASATGVSEPEAGQAWQVRLVANFERRSAGQPIIVAVFDRANATAIAQKNPQLIWDVTTAPVRYLGLRALFRPGSGFERSHTYLVRVVQLGPKERVLAEGEVRLE
jgi:hypothetical protein